MIVHPTANKYVTPELILNAYYQGFFPMANERGGIGFYLYEPRGIMPLDDRFVVRRSLRQVLKKKNYRITYDTAPLEILRGCSRIGEVPSYELWLSDELIELYLKLFEMGRVHTVEVWGPRLEEDLDLGAGHPMADTKFPSLIGGLYGLTFGGAFCGESMFSRADYASQIALVHLVERLRTRGFQLLDAQMSSTHLKQFGLYECGQQEYLEEFHQVADMDVKF